MNRATNIASLSGVGATLAVLGIYFGVLTLVSGWNFAAAQFGEFWYFITALAAGFGIQVGLYVYLRIVARPMGSGIAVAATGTTSTAAMISCCTHYLVNILPILGVAGVATFVAVYQTELFWIGIAFNLLGIAFIGRRFAIYAGHEKI